MPLPQMIVDRYTRLRAWFAQNAQVANMFYPIPGDVGNVRMICFMPGIAINLGANSNPAVYVADNGPGRLMARAAQSCIDGYNDLHPGPPPEYPMPQYQIYASGPPPEYYLPTVLVRLPEGWLDNLQDADVNFLSAMVPLHEMGHALLGRVDPMHQGESYAYMIELNVILHFIQTTVPNNGAYAAPVLGITTTAQAVANFIVSRGDQYAIAKNAAERAVRNTELPDSIDQITVVLAAAGLPQVSVAALNQVAAGLRTMAP
ncbi:hypothetical protein [Kitasatospora kifunensis]|uniref:Uncharacterized protein n=1 Tax=Kitasatospora kifunensis TaxID=58351 RepID=A0A7W7R9P7_KITKI|nr:hypothetical protein [Kitasatospora kifunensis]MBB4927978.1 hypothetical protein [Kitasatospora kifunensis]